MIRLRLEEQSDLGLHCMLKCLSQYVVFLWYSTYQLMQPWLMKGIFQEVKSGDTFILNFMSSCY